MLVLTHWSYVFLALTCWYITQNNTTICLCYFNFLLLIVIYPMTYCLTVQLYLRSSKHQVTSRIWKLHPSYMKKVWYAMFMFHNEMSVPEYSLECHFPVDFQKSWFGFNLKPKFRYGSSTFKTAVCAKQPSGFKSFHTKLKNHHKCLTSYF